MKLIIELTKLNNLLVERRLSGASNCNPDEYRLYELVHDFLTLELKSNQIPYIVYPKNNMKKIFLLVSEGK